MSLKNNNIVITDDKCIIHVNKRRVWRDIIILNISALSIVFISWGSYYYHNHHDLLYAFYLLLISAAMLVIFWISYFLLYKWLQSNIHKAIVLTESGVTLPNGNFYKWEEVTALRFVQKFRGPNDCELVINTYKTILVKDKYNHTKYRYRYRDRDTYSKEDIIYYWYRYADKKTLRKLFERYAGKDLYEFKKFKLF